MRTTLKTLCIVAVVAGCLGTRPAAALSCKDCLIGGVSGSGFHPSPDSFAWEGTFEGARSRDGSVEAVSYSFRAAGRYLPGDPSRGTGSMTLLDDTRGGLTLQIDVTRVGDGWAFTSGSSWAGSFAPTGQRQPHRGTLTGAEVEV